MTRRALALVVALALCAWAATRLLPPAPQPNVLLVTIDTLRADHVGCYGAAGAATPHLDALAARGARFATAIAHAPLTGPSHASILTGLTPLGHGVRDNGSFALPAAIPTLAEAFARAGYRTAAFVSGFPLDHRFGLGRGFQLYDDHLPHGHDPRRAPYVERPADATTNAVLRWLENDVAPSPWLAWVHYFDPHSPYEPPGDFGRRFADRPYDGEIAFADEQLGRLLDALQTKRLLDRTIILVTADHGESLGEHGEDTHGVFVYDATLRVPWIMAGPGVPAKLVPTVVARGIDVAPTLLELARLRGLAGAHGRSLVPALRRKAMEDAPAYAESLFARLNLGWAPLHAWRTARFKLIEAPRPELYALDGDPGERTDVFAVRNDVGPALRQALGAALQAKPPQAEAERSSDAAERLRGLGYVTAGAAPAVSLRDPKEGIDLIRRLERGLADARSSPDTAIADLTAVLKQDPRMMLAVRYRAIAFQVRGRYDEALADLRAISALGPLSVEDLVLEAETLRLAGRNEAALAALDTAAGAQRQTPEPLLIRGRVLKGMGRNAEARTAFEAVLTIVPGHFEALRGLADLALADGRTTDAAAYYEQILGADGSDVGALVHLGVARVRGGQMSEALALLKRAVERDPANAEALLYFAGALAKAGRPAEAVPYFERAIDSGGATTVALNGLGFARLESGDRRSALDALARSLKLDPRQPQVAGAVAQIRAGR